MSQEVLDQLADFLIRDDVSRPSSCRSVVVGGEECPVRYWQDSIKQLITQYLLELPGGVKRSYIHAHNIISEAMPCLQDCVTSVRTLVFPILQV